MSIYRAFSFLQGGNFSSFLEGLGNFAIHKALLPYLRLREREREKELRRNYWSLKEPKDVFLAYHFLFTS